MTDQAISPLRQRMIEDMTIRKLAPKTQASYIRAVRNFTIFLGRSPDQASAEDLRHYQLHLITIAADPKHLGARIGLTAVLHTWGSALTHHPHVHCIVPGGGLAPDGERWISCRPGFFLPVRVLSRLFRRLFLEELAAAHDAGRLHFFGDHAPLAERCAFAAHLAPPGADAYILKSIIHDWDDQRSIAILRNCRRAMPVDGRLLLVERVMPVRVEASQSHRQMAMIDIHMLVLAGGCERTEVGYKALFASSGFELADILPLPEAAGISLIEAAPVRR